MNRNPCSIQQVLHNLNCLLPLLVMNNIDLLRENIVELHPDIVKYGVDPVIIAGVAFVIGFFVVFKIVYFLFKKLTGVRDINYYQISDSHSPDQYNKEEIETVTEYNPSLLKSRAQKALNEQTTWTRDQVAQHNSENDLWIICNGRVFDVTSFVEFHPGKEAIANHAGKDNTKAVFENEAHPVERIKRDLEKFFVGVVEGKKSR